MSQKCFEDAKPWTLSMTSLRTFKSTLNLNTFTLFKEPKNISDTEQCFHAVLKVVWGLWYYVIKSDTLKLLHFHGCNLHLCTLSHSPPILQLSLSLPLLSFGCHSYSVLPVGSLCLRDRGTDKPSLPRASLLSVSVTLKALCPTAHLSEWIDDASPDCQHLSPCFEISLDCKHLSEYDQLSPDCIWGLQSVYCNPRLLMIKWMDYLGTHRDAAVVMCGVLSEVLRWIIYIRFRFVCNSIQTLSLSH